jgi:hypothetical protein
MQKADRPLPDIQRGHQRELVHHLEHQVRTKYLAYLPVGQWHVCRIRQLTATSKNGDTVDHFLASPARKTAANGLNPPSPAYRFLKYPPDVDFTAARQRVAQVPPV